MVMRRALDPYQLDRPDAASGIDGTREGDELVRRRYDRIAPIYDALQAMMELSAGRWRRELWTGVTGGRVLEIGVGTGKSVPFYPAQADIVAIDISEKMLDRARRRAARLGAAVRFEVADVQRLPYPDGSFDTALATFVFCSVPDPVRGLSEVRRVLRPGGRLLLLEHVLSQVRPLRWLMRALDPLVSRLGGAHLDRETVASVGAAGFADVRAANLALDVVKRIEAVAPAATR